MSFGSLYVESLGDDYGLTSGWEVNWPPMTLISVGDIGVLKPNRQTGLVGFSRLGRGSDYAVDVPSLESFASRRDVSLTKGDEAGVEFGFDASTPKWRWLGGADAGFIASFGDGGGVQIDLVDFHRTRVGNIGLVVDSMKKATQEKKLPVGYAIIVEVDTAQSGVIIASEGRGGELRVSASVDLKPAQIRLASFANSFSVESRSGAALYGLLPDPFVFSYRVLVVGKKGFWWWKKFVIHTSDGHVLSDHPVRSEISVRPAFEDSGAGLDLDFIESTLDASDYLVEF